MSESTPKTRETPFLDRPLVRAGVPLLVIGGMFIYFLYAREGGPGGGQGEAVRLAYVEWDSELASVSVVQAVIEDRLGVPCETLAVSAAAMWKAVASGDCDATLAAWLPDTHEPYYTRFKDEVVNLGPNLEGTRIGLAVPDYVDVDAIGDLTAYDGRFQGEIVGIDPGAGIMRETQEAMEAYGLDDYRLVSSSSAAMAATLGDAIRKEDWIVVTAWTPHWIFHRWDLHYLADPKNSYGDAGHIATIVREGLETSRPQVYRFLDRFHWTPDDMQQVMAWNQKANADPAETARRWIENNPERVDAWLEGIETAGTAAQE